ncbi:MAG: RpiB/LacA/LacB family sugar-phosphate isomerase [Candidatus Magasanikbacteria bacterium]|nr:RpiB/LacA/LacB family sugar-phosphate isomerase [Candidatus Magasanikbacteria bacterium]
MIYIGADHAGFELKEAVVEYLRYVNIPFEDLGPKTMIPDDDYPKVAHAVAEKVEADPKTDRGLLFCGNGVGVCVVANKHKGVRAGIGYNLQAAETMRTDDDANVLCLAGRILQPDFAKAIVKKFLNTKFSGEARHVRRIAEVAALEK